MMTAKAPLLHHCGLLLRQCLQPIARKTTPQSHALPAIRWSQLGTTITTQTFSSQSVCPDVEEFDPQSLTITDCVYKYKPCKWSNHVQKLLSRLDPEQQQQVTLFRMEYEMLAATGSRVPEVFTDEMIVFLLYKSLTASARRRDMAYWFKLEKSIQRDQKQKNERKQKRAEKKSTEEKGEFDDRIMFRIRKDTMRKHYWNHLFHAMQHGPHLIFDCGYDIELTERETFNMAKQFRLCSNFNLVHKNPFHFHFCNLQADSLVLSRMEHLDSKLHETPVTVSEDCFLNHYPKEQLVYLTPDARTPLKTVEADKTYIIGGIVDLGATLPLSMAKAKRHGIKMAKLPLDDHVKWVKGSKCLTIDQVVKILHEQKETGDWNGAFLKHLPRRKFLEYNANPMARYRKY